MELVRASDRPDLPYIQKLTDPVYSRPRRCVTTVSHHNHKVKAPSVESGDTMRAAGLHAIDTILTTEAVLIKSNAQKHPDLEPLIKMITSRIAGVVAASRYVICQYNIPRDKLSSATLVTPGRRAPTISPLEDEGWVAVSSMVEKKTIATIMDELMKIGAEDILVFNLDNCRV